MAQAYEVENAKTRTPDDHTQKEFPKAHCLFAFPDGTMCMYDEKNGEYMLQHGRTGSKIGFNNSGDSVSFTVGNKAEYNKSGTTVTVDHNGDVKIHGHNRIMVGGGSHFEVAGDAGIFVGGDTAVVGMGKVNMRGKSAYIGTDGDIAMNAGGNMEINVKGTMHLKASEIRHNSSGGFSK